MTNQELYNYFTTLAFKNPLDGYCELMAFKKEYKKTQFYVETKMPLLKAYECVCKNLYVHLYNQIREIMDIDCWKVKIENFINDLDPNTIQDMISKLVSSFNMEELSNEKGELISLLNQMKSLG